MKAVNLKCSSYTEPLLIDTGIPDFSWIIPCENNGTGQTAYQISVYEVMTSKSDLPQIWNTGKVNSDKSIHVLYSGEPLKPHTTYEWMVKIWDESDLEYDWSDPAFFSTGLMETWAAKWIGYDKIIGEPFNPSIPFYCADDCELGKNKYYLPPVPYLRKDFKLQSQVSKATLYVSAFGLAETQINGKKAGSDYFVPGLSDYSKTVYARAYDVTSMLNEGDNTVGVILADGWYAGYIGLNSREWYGSKPRAMIQINILLADGTAATIVSEESWSASYGPLDESDIFQGETYDARKELTGWSEPGYHSTGWEAVEVGAENEILPTSHMGVPVVEHGRITPKNIIKKSPNRIIIDFGENFTGVLAITVKGDRGSKIIIRHAEILNDEQELHLLGNRSARCQDTYILKGTETEYYQPKFTYHGFRFAEITGVDSVDIIEIEGVNIASEMTDLTAFECSSETINTIFDMIRKTQRSNQFETPTDCCARDERLGWGLEGNHFAYAMTYMNNQEAFVRKWCKDIWDGQRDSGVLEAIAPPMLMKDVEPFVGDLHSNNGIYMIYTLYKMYGQTQLIKDNFEKLQKYFDYLERNSDRHIRFTTTGDWLGILESTDHTDFLHGNGDCSPAMLGTCHYAVAAQMMVELSRGIGKDHEADRYLMLYQNIKKAFCQHFIQRDGSLRGGKQGDYLMALACDFFPAKIKEKAAEHFYKELTGSGRIYWRGGTVTTPFFLRTLHNLGRDDLANRFLTSTEYPSIGYMHKMGGTTIWERWDGIFEDGSIHPQVMDAMNHIGLATVADYFVGGLAGIDTLAPGFKKILIRPGISAEVTRARTAYQSPYGEITVDWEWDHDIVNLKCKIPANTTAQIILPCDHDKKLHMISGDAQDIIYKEGKVEVTVLSGTYSMQAGFDSAPHEA